MANGRGRSILEPIRQLFGAGTVAGLGDGALLERFVTARDEAAFEALVTRLGPMVLGVCRRALDDPADVDDTFQATFLILVRKARGIRDRDHLGPWLYGVARRVAVRARKQGATRRARERAGLAREAEVMAPAGEGAERLELRAALDEEVGRLPEKYRAPIVLCYLEGLTHEEAAARLRWPVGTVRSRMAWARDRLRTRLGRRGLSESEGLMGTLLLCPTVPAALARGTVLAAARLLAGHGAAGAVSAGALALAKRVGWTMIGNQPQVLAAMVVTTGVVSGGTVVVARQFGDKVPTEAPPVGAAITIEDQAKSPNLVPQNSKYFLKIPEVEPRNPNNLAKASPERGEPELEPIAPLPELGEPELAIGPPEPRLPLPRRTEAPNHTGTLLERINALERRQGELEQEVQALREVVGGGPATPGRLATPTRPTSFKDGAIPSMPQGGF